MRILQLLDGKGYGYADIEARRKVDPEKTFSPDGKCLGPPEGSF
jgi:hypothetical protein